MLFSVTAVRVDEQIVRHPRFHLRQWQLQLLGLRAFFDTLCIIWSICHLTSHCFSAMVAFFTSFGIYCLCNESAASGPPAVLFHSSRVLTLIQYVGSCCYWRCWVHLAVLFHSSRVSKLIQYVGSPLHLTLFGAPCRIVSSVTWLCIDSVRWQLQLLGLRAVHQRAL